MKFRSEVYETIMPSFYIETYDYTKRIKNATSLSAKKNINHTVLKEAYFLINFRSTDTPVKVFDLIPGRFFDFEHIKKLDNEIISYYDGVELVLKNIRESKNKVDQNLNLDHINTTFCEVWGETGHLFGDKFAKS